MGGLTTAGLPFLGPSCRSRLDQSVAHKRDNNNDNGGDNNDGGRENGKATQFTVISIIVAGEPPLLYKYTHGQLESNFQPE